MSDERVAVIIGTYGDMDEWLPLMRRASASVSLQTRPADAVLWEHGDTLQHARNLGAAKAAHCDWFIFLDADDELDPLYIESMLDGHGDIRRPSTLGVYEDGHEDDYPVLIPERPLNEANCIVIGAMINADLFLNTGGFDDWPVLEDWECFQRLVLNGASVGAVPAAVYRVHVRSSSRNSDQGLHDETYQRIRLLHAQAWAERGRQ